MVNAAINRHRKDQEHKTLKTEKLAVQQQNSRSSETLKFKKTINEKKAGCDIEMIKT